MTLKQKNEIIAEVAALLEKTIIVDEERVVPNIVHNVNQPVEMLTIKECAETVSGLSEHTVRQLVKQGKISFIRTGAGNNGKILVSKSALIDYLNGNAA